MKSLKKKANAPLCLKKDSFVVETETHFPTDYNLLFDSGRKCIEMIKKLGIPIGYEDYKKLSCDSVS